MICFFTSTKSCDKVTQITIIAKTVKTATKHAINQFKKYSYKGEPVRILAT